MNPRAITRHDPRKIGAWLASMRQAGAAHWQLVQIRGGRHASIVRRFVAAEATAETFPAVVLEAAQGDADDTAPGVTTTFALVAADNDGELGRHTFRLSGRARDINDAGPDEDPTIEGVIGQFLRHNEAVARSRFGLAAEVNEGWRPLVAAYETRLATTETENKALRDRVAHLEGKLDGYADERAKVAERKTENDLKLREADARNARTGKLIGFALGMLPMLLRARGVETGRDAEFAAFVATIEPEQLPKLAAALTPAQQAQLATLLKKYLPEAPEAPAAPPAPAPA